MKTILYMAQSVNGYIAKANGDSEWMGEADLTKFLTMTTKAGNVIMGRNTYEYLQTNGEFPLANRLNVVVTRHVLPPENDQVMFTDATPGEVINMMRERNFEQAMVIGGGKIAKSFLEAGLINELYVTLAPYVFGRGIPFIEPGEFVEEGDLEIQLKLLEIDRLSNNEIQLHYQVVRDRVLESDKGNESEEFIINPKHRSS